MRRCYFKAILKVMEYNESSSDSSASIEEDDIDVLLCELAFWPKHKLRPFLNLEELFDLECEQLFR